MIEFSRKRVERQIDRAGGVTVRVFGRIADVNELHVFEVDLSLASSTETCSILILFASKVLHQNESLDGFDADARQAHKGFVNLFLRIGGDGDRRSDRQIAFPPRSQTARRARC